MSVRTSQLRAVRELMHQRTGYVGSPSPKVPPVGLRVATPQSQLTVLQGGLPERPAAHAELGLALGDIVLSLSAVDGAIAVERGTDLRVVTSARGLIARRTLSREMSPALWEVMGGNDPLWVADPTSAGVHLPPHAQVLAVPFIRGGKRALALLTFHHRRHLSGADLRWLTHVLTQAASRDAGDAPIVDEGVAA